MTAEKQGRMPKIWEALAVFLLILVVIASCSIFLGVDVQIALFIGVIIAAIFALILGYNLKSIESMVTRGLEGSAQTVLFNMFIGFIIASWITSGVIPYIIYLGLSWITPALVPVLACLICSLMSVIIGSSWTTAGTLGLAFVSIGLSMNIPIGLLVGAVVSGAMFGDKQSPLSETTVLAAGVSRVDLFKHVAAMRYTSMPAIIIALIFYTVLGIRYANSGNIDMSEIEIIRTTLSSTFNFSPFLLLMPVMLIFLLTRKVNSTACLVIAILAGILVSIFYQGIPLADLSWFLMDGMKVDSGMAFVDEICSKGGLNAMWWVISLILLGFAMSEILVSTKVFHVIVEALSRVIRSVSAVICASLVTGLTLNAGTATPYITSLITATMFREKYDQLGIDRTTLSRTIEDATTIPLLVPWDSTVVFFCTLFGCTFGDFFPYYILGYLCPLLSVFCAFSGYGVLYTNGQKGWGKNKYRPGIDAPITAETTERYYLTDANI